MQRFYENLLGRRKDLDQPMSKAEALREAKSWLRGLTPEEVGRLLTALPGNERGERKGRPATGKSRRYEHPNYWAAFILIGDPS